LSAALTACLMVRDQFPRDSWYHLCGIVLFSTSKLVSLLLLAPGLLRQFTPARLLGYLFWLGLRPQPFLDNTPLSPEPRHSLWLTGLVNLAVGGVLLWAVPHWLPAATPDWLRIWIGIVGFSLFILFGVFDWIAALYRWRGVPVEKLWDNPLAATS